MKHTSYMIWSLLIIACFILSACAQPTPEPTATSIPATDTPPATFTPEPTATSTPKPTATPRPTSTPNIAATEEYNAIKAQLQEYMDAGYISSTNGSLKKIEDYTDAWAQIGWYQWHYTDYAPSNFVLETDIQWESASSAADSSGCGFVYHLKDNDNYYVMYVSLKGMVVLYSVTGGGHQRMGTGRFGSAAQNGKVHLTLIVEKNTFRMLIDNELVKTYTGLQDKLTSGKLAYTIFSGTNKDFGTRCSFTNSTLWTLP